MCFSNVDSLHKLLFACLPSLPTKKANAGYKPLDNTTDGYVNEKAMLYPGVVEHQAPQTTTVRIVGAEGYCLHWLHTGECEFRHQGCPYKHEIPDSEIMFDKLGFKAIPRWMDESEQILPVKTMGTSDLAYPWPIHTEEHDDLLDFVKDEPFAPRWDLPPEAWDMEARPAPEDVASRVFAALSNSDHPAYDLRFTVEDVMYQTAWWKERFAKALLATVEKALVEGTVVLKGAMGEAYEKATRAADGIAGFAHDHPIWTGVIAVVVALGILYLLMPCVLEILGFGVEGPIEGSFAAFWQSTYGGYVPARSLFSYLQRLGMTCRWGVQGTIMMVDNLDLI